MTLVSFGQPDGPTPQGRSEFTRGREASEHGPQCGVQDHRTSDRYRNRYRCSVDLLRHLRYFQAVAEELHFGRAAERLGMAQPPLSQRIRGLEEELGVRLFDRSGRQVRLTEAGAALLAESPDLLARVERIRVVVTRAHRGENGALRTGVPPELPGRMLAAILTDFAVLAPGVRLDVQELSAAEQAGLLADGQLDVGLFQRPADLTGLQSGAVVELPLGVVVPRGSPLATSAGDLVLTELAGQCLVMSPRAAAPELYDATLNACRAQGFDPVQVSHARTPEVMLSLVIAGQGVAFSYAATAQKEPRVVWRPLAAGTLTWPMAFARPDSAPHPAADTLIRSATRTLRAHVGASVSPAAAPAVAGRQGEPDRPWDVVYPVIGLTGPSRPSPGI